MSRSAFILIPYSGLLWAFFSFSSLYWPQNWSPNEHTPLAHRAVNSKRNSEDLILSTESLLFPTWIRQLYILFNWIESLYCQGCASRVKRNVSAGDIFYAFSGTKRFMKESAVLLCMPDWTLLMCNRSDLTNRTTLCSDHKFLRVTIRL